MLDDEFGNPRSDSSDDKQYTWKETLKLWALVLGVIALVIFMAMYGMPRI